MPLTEINRDLASLNLIQIVINYLKNPNTQNEQALRDASVLLAAFAFENRDRKGAGADDLDLFIIEKIEENLAAHNESVFIDYILNINITKVESTDKYATFCSSAENNVDVEGLNEDEQFLKKLFINTALSKLFTKVQELQHERKLKNYIAECQNSNKKLLIILNNMTLPNATKVYFYEKFKETKYSSLVEDLATKIEKLEQDKSEQKISQNSVHFIYDRLICTLAQPTFEEIFNRFEEELNAQYKIKEEILLLNTNSDDKQESDFYIKRDNKERLLKILNNEKTSGKTKLSNYSKELEELSQQKIDYFITEYKTDSDIGIQAIIKIFQHSKKTATEHCKEFDNYKVNILKMRCDERLEQLESSFTFIDDKTKTIAAIKAAKAELEKTGSEASNKLLAFKVAVEKTQLLFKNNGKLNSFWVMIAPILTLNLYKPKKQSDNFLTTTRKFSGYEEAETIELDSFKSRSSSRKSSRSSSVSQSSGANSVLVTYAAPIIRAVNTGSLLRTCAQEYAASIPASSAYAYTG